jgi:formylglycine-generating enzyme required for sulfatase activity
MSSSAIPLHEVRRRWEEAYRRGIALTAEQLCHDCPEHLELIRKQVPRWEASPPPRNDDSLGLPLDTSSGPTDQGSWGLQVDAAEAREPPAVPSPQPGAELVPGYRPVRQLGKGAFGEVWQAIGPGGVPVALKLIPLQGSDVSPELRALELMKSVRHAHLLALAGCWQVGTLLVVAFELADGTLMQRLQQCQAEGLPGIPPEELRCYMREAAKGIDFLNEPRHSVEGRTAVAIQHRDVKPANLLLVGGSVKVGDFGLAKLLDRTVAANSGALTVSYAAPECFRNQTTHFSDQYALAVSYCQLRGGRLPFEGPVAAVMAGHLSGTPDLSMLPQEERRVVARALSKQPERRWPSCCAFVEALDDLAEGRRRRSGTGRKVVLALGIVLLALLPVLWWLLNPEPTPAEKAAARAAKKAAEEEAERLRQQEQSKKHADDLQRQARVLADKQQDYAGAVRLLDQVPAYLRDGELYDYVKERRAQIDGLANKLGAAIKARQLGNSRALANQLIALQPHQVQWQKTLAGLPREALAGKEVENSIGMKLVRIAPGRFKMGSPESEVGRRADEHAHEVEITRPFYLGMYEVTQAQYEKVMGTNPSFFSAGGKGAKKVSSEDTGNLPVERVSWNDAQEFLKKLSALPAEQQAGRSYRLPTEAEWEYACRAGSNTPYSSGDTNADLAKVGWFVALSAKKTHPVESLMPNAWGLYHMHGNVLEWCQDRYNPDFYQKSPRRDPLWNGKGKGRVARGGSVFTMALLCRSATRFSYNPGARINNLGFRIVCIGWEP